MFTSSANTLAAKNCREIVMCAMGFLFSERLIAGLTGIRVCSEKKDQDSEDYFC
jgi:hypothetical protein